MTFFDSAIRIIENEVQRLGSIYAFGKAHGVCANKISFWLKRKTKPNLQDIGVLLDAMGYMIVQKTTVNAVRIVKVGGDVTKDSYISIPVVDDVRFLPAFGPVPESNTQGCAIVNADFESVRNRTDLVAIHIEDDAMSPTIVPGSMVLIDRADRTPVKDGELWLCRAPNSNLTAIRRVALEGDNVIFWNDNPNSMPPRTYSVKHEYDGVLGNAILGRATWQRSRLY